ncbi:hypothetical protein K435DRAFT_715656 [Dendrothele bispora CBS 962.96]|uniref:Uncharacterized protein n=1 Tax=Dendrothele bispora (strain CBS 962.96) TaxID=1314807 RepID=A0A4S8MKH5_DENBC|nr:hypothetical protein K435DRAFT_715656 [Dendrothele bispora CBS 962.96]
MPSLLPFSDLQLPNFKSLLVQGPYHPSAPIHLALTHTAQQENFITLFLSAAQLGDVLKDYNDRHLNSHSGLGNTSEVSSRIKIFYPPSPAHLSVLLSLFHKPSPSNPGVHHPNVTLSGAPSLIILYELSSYFLPQVESQPTSHSWTLASYLTLVMRTFSAIAQRFQLEISQSGVSTGHQILSRRPSTGDLRTTVALFDSQLYRLKLPVHKSPSASDDDMRAPDNAARTVDVATYLYKYFEWIIVAECEDFSDPPTIPQECVSKKVRLKLSRSASLDDVVEIWTWIERRSRVSDSERWVTEFVECHCQRCH